MVSGSEHVRLRFDLLTAVVADADQHQGPATTHPVRRRMFELVLVFACGVGVMIAMTWPLASSINSRSVDPYDPLFQAWTIDWVQHSVAPGGDSIWDANIFEPSERALTYSDNLIVPAITLLPARWAGMTPIGVLNVGLLIAAGLNVALAYGFALRVTGSRPGGAIAAAVFAFGPYNTQITQHLHIYAHAGLAAAGWSAWELARASTKRRRWIAAACLSASVALTGAVSFYQLPMVALVAAIILLVQDRRARTLVAGAVAAGVGVVALLPLLIPYLVSASEIGSGYHWSLASIGAGSANFTRADPRLWVWGALGRPNDIFFQATFPGIAVTGIAVAGVVAFSRRRWRRSLTIGALLTVAGFVLALGTAASGWRRWLPYHLLYLLPGGDGLRAVGRFWVVGLLGLGLVGAALCAAVELRRSTRASAALAAVIVVAVLVEGARQPSALHTIRPHRIDAVLAGEKASGGVLYLPFPPAEPAPIVVVLSQADVVYRTTAHHRPTPNGYSGYFPSSLTTAVRAAERLPAASSVDYFCRIGTRFVIAPEVVWDRLRGPRFEPVRTVDGEVLGRLTCPTGP
jgi:hypothetical protein